VSTGAFYSRLDALRAGHDPVGEARLYADSIGVVQPVVGIWQGLFLAVGSCY
jgi:hypothetical protein